jgi:hypothetical protein
MNGVKSAARLRSAMTPLATYRTIASADGAVNPASPPAIATFDLTKSPVGLNTVQAFITPQASGGNPVMEMWVVMTESWYFLGTVTITNGKPQIWTIEDVPCGLIAVTWLSGGSGPVTVQLSATN